MAEVFAIEDFDLLPNLRGSRNLGKPGWTDAGWKKFVAGERWTEADRTPRTIAFTYTVQGATVDALRAEYAALKAKLLQVTFVLTNNFGGATEASHYYDCYGCTTVPEMPTDLPTSVWLEWDIHIEITARPFSRSTAIDLPRNWIKDADLGRDDDGDGIPNSFVADDSGTPATGSVSVHDGYTEIVVTAGAAGRYKGIKQEAVACPSTAWFLRGIEYNISGLANGATVNIGFDSDDNGPTVSAAANTSGWVKIYTGGVLNSTPGILHIRVLTSGATSACTLKVRNALASDISLWPGAATGGADGINPIFACSEAAESPAILKVENVPGDVPATARIQIASTAVHSDGTGNQPDVIGLGFAHHPQPVSNYSGILGKSPFVLSATYQPNPACLGGKMSDNFSPYADDHIFFFATNLSLRGRFYIFARMTTTDVNFATRKYYLTLYPHGLVASGGTWEPRIFRTEPLVFFTANNHLQLNCLGMVNLPLSGAPDNVDFAYDLGIAVTPGFAASGYQYNIDYIVFIPVDGGFVRGEIGNNWDANSGIGVMADTSSQMSGLHRLTKTAAAPVTWPQDNTNLYPMIDSVIGDPIYLEPGRVNSGVILATNALHADADETSDINGAYLAVQITPRWLE